MADIRINQLTETSQFRDDAYAVLSSANETEEKKINKVNLANELASTGGYAMQDKWGVPKGGYILDGKSYVRVNKSMDGFGDRNFSVEAYFKLTDAPSEVKYLLRSFSNDANTHGSFFLYHTTDGSLKLAVKTDNNAYSYFLIKTNASNEKYHLIIVFDRENSLIKFYNNGVFLSDVVFADAGDINVDEVYIGISSDVSLNTAIKASFYFARFFNTDISSYVNVLWNNGKPEKAVIPFEIRGASNIDDITNNGDITGGTNGWVLSGNVAYGTDNIVFTADGSTRTYAFNNFVKPGKKAHKYKVVYEISQNSLDNPNAFVLMGDRVSGSSSLADVGGGLVLPSSVGVHEVEFMSKTGNVNVEGVELLTSATSGTLTLEYLHFHPIGNVAEYRGENMGANGMVDTSGNNLHGQNVGAISMSDNKRDVVVGIGADGQATDVVPQNAILEYIQIKNTSSVAITVNIGTSALGSDVGSATVGAGEIATLPVNKAFSDTDATTLYISDADGDNSWNGATLNIAFYNKTLGV